MTDDERAIRTLIETWMTASSAGDVPKVLGLMADDVVFMVAGREPFGKSEFAAMSEKMKGVRMEAKSDVRELAIAGDWAWCRTHITIVLTPPGGESMRRSGYTLTILKKNHAGAWLLARDANLTAAE